MISVFDGNRMQNRQPKKGTWPGGETVLIYSNAADQQPMFGVSSISFGTATIERNAAFSYFPSVTRIHMPLTGSGIRLRFQQPAEDVILPTFAQYRFDGARPLQAELIDGPISAFNLMIETSMRGLLTLLHPGKAQQAFTQALATIQPDNLFAFYLVNSSLTLTLPDQPTLTLHAEDTLIIEPGSIANPGGILQSASADTLVLLVEVDTD